MKIKPIKRVPAIEAGSCNTCPVIHDPEERQKHRETAMVNIIEEDPGDRRNHILFSIRLCDNCLIQFSASMELAFRVWVQKAIRARTET